MNPRKSFRPGQVYTPFDLNPRSQATYVPPPSLSDFTQGQMRVRDFLKYSHPTNLPYIVRFLSETGRMLPMRVTNFEMQAQACLKKVRKRAIDLGLLSSIGRPVEIIGEDHPYRMEAIKKRNFD